MPEYLNEIAHHPCEYTEIGEADLYIADAPDSSHFGIDQNASLHDAGMGKRLCKSEAEQAVGYCQKEY